MARLDHPASARSRPIAARTLVGRSPLCTLRLDDPHVSSEHATLTWTPDGTWELRDLGSKNGTFVDDRRLDPGEVVVVGAGTRLGFGDAVDTWIIADGGAPGLVAVELGEGRVVDATDGILALPDDTTPALSIFESAAGQWIVESPEADPRVVLDQEILHTGGGSWRIQLPQSVEGTPLADRGPSLDTASFRFLVSADEERVEIRVRHRGHEIVLEPREHSYVLLTLARARLDDAGSAPTDRGWLDRDEILRMLRMDANGFNVAVHRGRRQLLSAGVRGAAGIVEVRRRQRRFGTDRVEVTRA